MVRWGGFWKVEIKGKLVQGGHSSEGPTALLSSHCSSLPLGTVQGENRNAQLLNLPGLVWFLHLMAVVTSDDEAKLIVTTLFQP